MTPAQQQALYDEEARIAALIERVRHPAAALSAPVALFTAFAALTAMVLPALCMACVGVPG